MTIRRFLVASAGAMLCCASPTWSAPETAIASGNELLANCRGSGWDQGYCTGFILGIFRGIEVYDAIKETRTFCATDQVTVEQSLLIVQQYLRQNPKMMDKPAEWGVVAALVDAFPCAKK